MEGKYDIQRIIEGLLGIKQLIPSGSMPSLTASLDDAVMRITEPMQLAIMGKIKVSKSTLVNAILGKKEFMATANEEMTYNVGWLKYGKPDADIIIHHKDKTPDTRKSQTDFLQWSATKNNPEFDNVSYIEVFDDSEILQELNIIDTPGLDSFYRKDSKNTLDFISKVRPDAIIMLYTHSPSENVVDVVSKFNSNGCTLNPLNAIGVLSKIDVLWCESDKDKSALDLGNNMAKRRMLREPKLKKTLSNIYPISSLLFLASKIMNDSVFENMVNISKIDDSILDKSLMSVDNFLESNDLPLSLEGKRNLLGTLDRYGIHLICQGLKNGSVTDLDSAKKLLYKESGAEEFMKILKNHFGKRAKLIKMESIYQNIQQKIAAEQATADVNILNKIRQRIADLFSSLVYDHHEYELLYQLYSGEKQIDESAKQEFLTLCGEHGNSAAERLGFPKNADLQQLADKAIERENYWRKQVSLEPDLEERLWMDTILSSYSRFRIKLQTMKRQYDEAKAFLFNE